MKKLFNFSVVFVLFLSFFSCKKKEVEEEKTPVTPAVNILCDGNGSGEYMPLALGNTWHYKTNQGFYSTDSISAVVTFSSISYFKMDNAALGTTLYLRKASNGDVMAYDTGSSAEYLFIPASPVTNQTWTYPVQFNTSKKVLGTGFNIGTGSCNYLGCLKMQIYGASGGAAEVVYYKKGIGMVSTDITGPGTTFSNLYSVILN